MTQIQNLRPALVRIIFFVIPLFLSGCEGKDDFPKKMQEINKLKNQVEQMQKDQEEEALGEQLKGLSRPLETPNTQ